MELSSETKLVKNFHNFIMRGIVIRKVLIIL